MPEGQDIHTYIHTYMLVYFMYITSSMIPLLLVLFLAAIALGLIERYILAILATMIAVEG
jgi:VIT1/CCC1 family predicted Fe2+/Mn2+ transporter